MRESIKDPSRIHHIHKAIKKINDFMNGKTAADLENESILFYAIVKNLEIIGEAIYKLTIEYKNSHPEVPWSDYEKLRHVLVHGYYTINSNIVYDIVKEDLPELIEILPKEY